LRTADVLAPLSSDEPCAVVPMSTAFEPYSSVALWNRFVKPVPVGSEPLLMTVAEREVLKPAVAESGVMVPAVKFGPGAVLTETEVAQGCARVCPPDVTEIAADFEPALAYDFVTFLVVPERPSVPLQTYV